MMTGLDAGYHRAGAIVPGMVGVLPGNARFSGVKPHNAGEKVIGTG